MQLYLVRWRKSECYIGQTWTSDLLSSMLCNVNIPSLSKGQNVFSWNGRSCRWFGAKDQNFCPSESIKPNKPVNIEWISDFVCIYWVLTVKSWTCHCLMCKCTVLCYMMMLHTDSMCFWIDAMPQHHLFIPPTHIMTSLLGESQPVEIEKWSPINILKSCHNSHALCPL